MLSAQVASDATATRSVPKSRGDTNCVYVCEVEQVLCGSVLHGMVKCVCNRVYFV